jgi:hypothetical protein
MWNLYKKHDDFVEVFLLRRNKEPLVTKIDHDSFEEMMNLDITWYAAYSPGIKGHYAVGFDGKKQVKMHRLITGCPDGLVVDHINHDSLDNRKENLRNVTEVENALNSRLARNNKSGAKGVFYRESIKKFVASFTAKGKSIHVGHFDSLEEATEAVKKAKMDFHGGEVIGIL